MVKRKKNLIESLCSLDNINLADNNARKNKKRSLQYIKRHDKHRDFENKLIKESFQNLSYITSKYITFKIYEPKERIIYKLPYYPDRIAHHAIMNIVKDLWTKQFIPNTYGCIEGRGIHKCAKDLKRDLEKTANNDETKYCLKLDISKFYPSINHEILKEIISRKIKDTRFLSILFEIIDSVNSVSGNNKRGVPIGNYLSQFFANLYLSYFDRWCKEELKCRYYYRYADDIVILSSNKNKLRNVLICIKLYLKSKLDLEVKSNYQIFPVENRGIDFVGYVFRHKYTRIRKSIKKSIFQLIYKFQTKQIDEYTLYKSLTSYFGQLKYADSKNLLHKIQELTGIKYSNFCGKPDLISKYFNKEIKVISVNSYHKYFTINFLYKGKPITVKSKDQQIFKFLSNQKLPILLKLNKNEGNNKTNQL